MDAKPLLLTMGDACGIGPETILKAVADGAALGCVVVADPSVLGRAARVLGLLLPLAQLDTLDDLAEVPPGALAVLRPPGLPEGLAELPWGRVDARCGAAASACIELAAKLLLAGRAAAMVTAPLHKEALAAAGIGFPGHTELLQALATPTGGKMPPVRMMLANDELRVVLVSIHVALRQAVDLVNFDAVLQTIRIAHASAAAWGQPRPRIAVAGLNPHAGEGGLFGDEELQHIAPAVRAAQAEDIDASGPYAPDTVFMRARHAPGHPGEFDLVIAMTHDHGLIPVKYLGVEQGVNVTLGLPFVRTSPDHGTAFDIAGSGRADASSLKASIHMARQLSARAD
jgi:4-hydroxythreonine-4-phosphate dehydrogenase